MSGWNASDHMAGNLTGKSGFSRVTLAAGCINVLCGCAAVWTNLGLLIILIADKKVLKPALSVYVKFLTGSNLAAAVLMLIVMCAFVHDQSVLSSKSGLCLVWRYSTECPLVMNIHGVITAYRFLGTFFPTVRFYDSGTVSCIVCGLVALYVHAGFAPGYVGDYLYQPPFASCTSGGSYYALWETIRSGMYVYAPYATTEAGCAGILVHLRQLKGRESLSSAGRPTPGAAAKRANHSSGVMDALLCSVAVSFTPTVIYTMLSFVSETYPSRILDWARLVVSYVAAFTDLAQPLLDPLFFLRFSHGLKAAFVKRFCKRKEPTQVDVHLEMTTRPRSARST